MCVAGRVRDEHASHRRPGAEGRDTRYGRYVVSAPAYRRCPRRPIVPLKL